MENTYYSINEVLAEFSEEYIVYCVNKCQFLEEKLETQENMIQNIKTMLNAYYLNLELK